MDEIVLRRLQAQFKALQRRQRQAWARGGVLSQSALVVAGSIARAPEGIRPRRIADELVMTSSNVAAALRELDALDLIVRSKDSGDSRRVIVRFTAAGEALVASSRTEREGWLGRAIAATLTDDEQQTLLAAGTLVERLAAYADPA